MIKKLLVLVILLLSPLVFADMLSLVKLITFPERYEDKKVVVTGYFVDVPGSSQRLYMNKESFLQRGPEYLLIYSYKNSLDVLIENKTCRLVMRGTFIYKSIGSPLRAIGGLKDIDNIVLDECD